MNINSSNKPISLPSFGTPTNSTNGGVCGGNGGGGVQVHQQQQQKKIMEEVQV